MVQRRFGRIPRPAQFTLAAFSLGDLFGRDVDADDVAGRPALRMPMRDPEPLLRLIGTLTGNLDTGHRLPGLHDRANDRLYRRGQRRDAIADRASKMALDRNSADLGETLVDLQIAAVGRQERKADRRRVIDQLQRRLFRKLHIADYRRTHVLSPLKVQPIMAQRPDSPGCSLNWTRTSTMSGAGVMGTYYRHSDECTLLEGIGHRVFPRIATSLALFTKNTCR